MPSSWEIPKIWEGQTVIIIGGGSSVRKLKQDRLLQKCRGRFPVIALNQAYEIAPWADVLMWLDQSWFNDNWRHLHIHTGWKVTCRYPRLKKLEPHEGNPVYWDSIKVLRYVSDGNTTLSIDPRQLRGRFAGSQAINFSTLAGAGRIVGLGFDANRFAEQLNWHDRYLERNRPTNMEVFEKHFIPDMYALEKELEGAGVQFYNASIDSAIRCYPFVDFEEVLSWEI